MLFKNLTAYRLTRPIQAPLGDLEASIATRPARDCQHQETEHLGFDYCTDDTRLRIWPLENEQVLYLRMQHAKVLLPGSVWKREANKRLKVYEKEHDTRLKGRDKREFLEGVRDEMLAKAFQKYNEVQVIIDRANGEVWIDQASEKTCEAALSLIRYALGSLSVLPVSKLGALGPWLKQWLEDPNTMPGGLDIGDEVKMADSNEPSATVNVKREDLDTTDIRQLLAHRDVVELGILFDGMKCRASDKIALKGIAPQEKLDLDTDDTKEGRLAEFESQLYLTVETLRSARSILAEAAGESLEGMVPEDKPEETQNEAQPEETA